MDRDLLKVKRLKDPLGILLLNSVLTMSIETWLRYLIQHHCALGRVILALAQL